MGEARAFPYHRGVAPMMWVMFALSLIELAAVHFLIALRWPYVGWPLTILSAAGAVGMLVWILSFRMRPHLLSDGVLHLRLGRFVAKTIPLSNIACVRRGWEQGAVDAKGTTNLAGIAYPNRCIDLVEPLARGRWRVFIRLDAPDEFDAAMIGRGIAFA